MLDNQVGALDQARDSEGAISPEQAKVCAQLADLSAQCFKHDLAVNDNTLINCFLEQEIERQNLGVAPGTAVWNTLARHGKQMMQEVCLADARRYRGDHDDAASYRSLGLPYPSEVQIAIQPGSTLSPMAKRPLSEIYAECRDHKIRKSQWKQTDGSLRSWLKLDLTPPFLMLRQSVAELAKVPEGLLPSGFSTSPSIGQSYQPLTQVG
jgi:hypothetical protein